jgi:protein AroM
MKKKIAAVTIGQTPRVDLIPDIAALLPDFMEIYEYGALDDTGYDTVMTEFHPCPGDEILVSRMRDGRQAQFTANYIIPRIQKVITLAESDGADAVILFCTGFFPQFRHSGLFIEPYPLLHSVAEKIAGGKKIGVLVPEKDQIEQAYESWGKNGVSVEVAAVSPYKEADSVGTVAKQFSGHGISLICPDCMGFSVKMKHDIQQATDIPVLLPRTLAVRILCDLFS